MISAVVKISREVPYQYFQLTLTHKDDQTLELDPEETREWFKLRGANMNVVEQALDYVWNFGDLRPVHVTIENFREPTQPHRPAEPEV